MESLDLLSWLVTGSIPLRIQLVAVAGSLCLMAIIVHLIRQERLKEGYSIIWFVVGVLIIIFSAFARLLDLFARFVGIAYAPAALFFILIAGLLLLSVHFSVLLSKNEKRIKELAQEHAILKQRLEYLKESQRYG